MLNSLINAEQLPDVIEARAKLRLAAADIETARELIRSSLERLCDAYGSPHNAKLLLIDISHLLGITKYLIQEGK